MSEEQEITKKDKKEVLLLQSEIIGKVKDLVGTALGLVAALAWNAAIQKLFEVVFPNKTNSLIAMFVYAVFVTVIIVFVIYYLTKVADRVNKKLGASIKSLDEESQKD